MNNEPTVCNCGQKCSCYFADRRVVSQRMEDDPNTPDKYDEHGIRVAGSVCVVVYETGEEQRLIRPWMDLWPQPGWTFTQIIIG